MRREGLGWSRGTKHGPHRTLGLGAARLREAAPSSTDGWGGRRHTSTELSWQEAWPPEKVRFISGAKGQAWEIKLSWLLVPKGSQQAGQPGPAHTPRGPYVHQTPDDPATERTERQAPTGQPPPQPSWEAGAPTVRTPSGSSKHSGRPEGTEDGQTPREGASTRDLIPLTREGPEERGCWMQGPLRAASKHHTACCSHTVHPFVFVTVNYSGTLL